MRTSIDIVNKALGLLNLEGIADLSELSPEADAARLHWEDNFKAFLEEHDWGFATREVRLARLPENNTGWPHLYSAPIDFLKIIRIENGSDRVGARCLPAYAVFADERDGQMQRVVGTTAEEAVMTYITDRGTLDMLSPMAAEALVYRLAYSIGQVLKQDNNETGTLFQMYLKLREVAAGKDMDNRSYHQLGGDSLTRVRRGVGKMWGALTGWSRR